MGTVVLAGATSGSTTLSPTDAVTTVITLPASTDTLVGKATTDTLTNKTLTAPAISSAVMTTMASSVLTLGTAVASTSGTSIDFTGIPSWVKRITVMFNGVSTNGTSYPLIQLGVSGVAETSGYLGCAQRGTAFTAYTTGYLIDNSASASSLMHGSLVLTLLNSASNTWSCSGVVGLTGSVFTSNFGGIKPLAGVLNMVRVTTVNGTDTFDAGSINIMYE